MPVPQKYFHDRVVLLLTSISVFLASLGSILVLLRLGGGNDGYIIAYRANLGISAYTAGSVREILAFVAFMVLVVALHGVLSRRVYHLRRYLALAVLSLGIVLLALTIVVSNALLVL